MKLVSKEVEQMLKKYGEIYFESIKMLETAERVNLIQAYFAGAMAQMKGDVNVDDFLNKIDNDTTTISN